MNSSLKKLVPIILFISNIIFIAHNSFLFSSANWGVTENTSTTYLLDSSSWSVNFGSLTGSGTGGVFNNLTIAEGNSFIVNVTEVNPFWGVDFKLSNTTDDSFGFNEYELFKFQFAKFLYYPIEEAERLYAGLVNQSQIAFGPPIVPWFFIEIRDELWDFFDQMIDINYHNSLPIAPSFDATFEGDFVRGSGLATFDVFMRGTYANSTRGAEFDFTHNIKFIWDLTTGILQGYRVSTIFTGTYYDLTISEDLSLVVKKTGFTLPSFKFGPSGFIPGFNWIITLASIGTLTLVIFLIRKRMQKGK
jgi:hypothetical protein